MAYLHCWTRYTDSNPDPGTDICPKTEYSVFRSGLESKGLFTLNEIQPDIPTLKKRPVIQYSIVSMKNGMGWEPILSIIQPTTIDTMLNWTRMHSSRMRTGQTLTVFRKLETPPKNLEQAPPENLEQAPPSPENLEQAPPENLEQTPPRNLEQAPPWDQTRLPPRKFGAGTPPPKIWSRHPPPKFGASTPLGSDQTPPGSDQTFPPPVNRMNDRRLWKYYLGQNFPPQNLEQAPPPPKNLEQTPPQNLEQTPPENLEQAPPLKIWSKHPPGIRPDPPGIRPDPTPHPPCEQNEWQTLVKILPWPKLRFSR